MITLFLGLLACASEPTRPLSAASPSSPKPPTTIRDGATDADIAWPPADVNILIDKSDRVLTVLSSNTELVSWPMGLGGAPAGDKVRQGDQKTPIGTFWIVTRNPQSSYHLFLGISYPDTGDAERGEANGWLTQSEADGIETATKSHVKPPWNTTLGGAIGIHGGGSGADWTLGCIALDNANIEELWELAPHGTKVVIRE